MSIGDPSKGHQGGSGAIENYKTNFEVASLPKDFNACLEVLSEFCSEILAPASKIYVGHFNLYGANLQMQTQFVSKILHKNLVAILQQFY